MAEHGVQSTLEDVLVAQNPLFESHVDMQEHQQLPQSALPEPAAEVGMDALTAGLLAQALCPHLGVTI